MNTVMDRRQINISATRLGAPLFLGTLLNDEAADHTVRAPRKGWAQSRAHRDGDRLSALTGRRRRIRSCFAPTTHENPRPNGGDPRESCAFASDQGLSSHLWNRGSAVTES